MHTVLPPQKTNLGIVPPYSGNHFEAKSDPTIYSGKSSSDLDSEVQKIHKSLNIAKISSDSYAADSGIKSQPLVGIPSSLSKQASIAHAFHLGASGDPQYKKHVFSEYVKKMPHLIKKHSVKDYDDLVAKSYSAASQEVEAQFRSLPIKTTFHDGDLNYPSSNHMIRDIHLHHHLSVFRGGETHEHLNKVDSKTGINTNEKFRAVHDFYGHGVHGNQFGPKGEEIAWEHHKSMFSPLASLAMTGETRGQNSWVNYSSANTEIQNKMEVARKERKEAINAGNASLASEKEKHISHLGSQWNYAKQASVILPPDMNSAHYKGEIPESLKKVTPNNGKYDIKSDPKGLVALAKLHNTSSHRTHSGGVLNQEGYDSDLKHILELHGHQV